MKTCRSRHLIVDTVNFRLQILSEQRIAVRILLEWSLDPVACRLGFAEMAPTNGQFSLARLTVAPAPSRWVMRQVAVEILSVALKGFNEAEPEVAEDARRGIT